VVVTAHAATLTIGRELPLTRAGLSPAGTRQLVLAHLILIAALYHRNSLIQQKDRERLTDEIATLPKWPEVP